MLVLSRQARETIKFPGLDIRIEILRCTSSGVKIGIDAPREISILRGELADKVAPAKAGCILPGAVKQSLIPSLQQTVHDAAATLNQLHVLTEDPGKQDYESAILGLFQSLKKLDSQISDLRQTSTPQDQAVRALLVDDNDNESKLLASYLRLKGIEVTTAENGQVALERMSQQPADIVLLDMSMPRFDGRWTIDQIRHNQELEDTTVFAVSGTDQADSDVVVGPSGVNGWFRKPLNPDDLILEITNSCRNRQPALN